MSFSLLVTLLTYWIYVNIGISPVLDIYFWNFWTYSQDISEIYPDYLNSYMSVSLSLHLLYLFQFVISGGQLLRPLVLLFYRIFQSLWSVWRAFWRDMVIMYVQILTKNMCLALHTIGYLRNQFYSIECSTVCGVCGGHSGEIW